MLLQTNSYIVPKEKRAEHSRLIRRFRQTLLRLGCDHFEVYEQVGSNWSNSESAGRYVQILRFLDRKHQLAVQSAERTDPTAQAVIADFCDLINFPYQQQQGLFAVGFYTSVLPVAPKRGARGELVSTVEHEVIDDPEAEKPYPGSSDGPPLEEGAADQAIEEPLSETGFEEEPLAESTGHFEELPEDSLEGPLEQEHEPLATPHAVAAEATDELHVAELPEEEMYEPLEMHTEEPEAILEPETHPAIHAVAHEPEIIEAELSETELLEEEPTESLAPALPEEVAAETSHLGSEPHIPEPESHSESTDDFMKLVGGDLSEHANEPLDEDDIANGFLEVDFDDELEDSSHLNGVQPTHSHPAENHDSR